VTSETGGKPARRAVLGRGLEALIPSYSETQPVSSILEVAIDSISPNPYQPRTVIDPEKIAQLADSIRTHGLIQPLIVTNAPESGQYLLIAGERRWRAARAAGLETAPVVVKDAAPRAMLELALVENVVRADLSPLEEATAYRQLIDDFGLTQAVVAERVGRSRVAVTNTLRLLGAAEAVQAALQEDRITEGHARALLGLPTAIDQVAMLRELEENGWNVRQTEEAVRKWVASVAKRQEKERAVVVVDHSGEALEDRLQRMLATKVTVRRPPGMESGALTIHFFSEEQLNAIITRLAGEEDW
jgi:ParB family transcriptional regulator, chromosome partitioning protein